MCPPITPEIYPTCQAGLEDFWVVVAESDLRGFVINFYLYRPFTSLEIQTIRLTRQAYLPNFGSTGFV